MSRVTTAGALPRSRRRLLQWVRRRHGPDTAPVSLHRRRLYILPTAQGLVFALLVFTMLLGSMNYDNAMGYLLTFLLGGMGMVTMHHAHRNLLTLRLHPLGAEPAFAGETLYFRFRLYNPSRLDRFEVVLQLGVHRSAAVDVPAGGEALISVAVPAKVRGTLAFQTVTIESRHPAHLFRAWSWAHFKLAGCVWPAPATVVPPVPEGESGVGESGAIGGAGEDDFSGLREFHRGDSPRRIAWKAYARDSELRIKQFSGDGAAPRWLALAHTPPGDLEQRLSVLCRWALDSQRAGIPYGLRLPGHVQGPDTGQAHLERVLTVLADFDGAHSDGEV